MVRMHFVEKWYWFSERESWGHLMKPSGEICMISLLKLMSSGLERIQIIRLVPLVKRVVPHSSLRDIIGPRSLRLRAQETFKIYSKSSYWFLQADARRTSWVRLPAQMTLRAYSYTSNICFNGQLRTGFCNTRIDGHCSFWREFWFSCSLSGENL